MQGVNTVLLKHLGKSSSSTALWSPSTLGTDGDASELLCSASAIVQALGKRRRRDANMNESSQIAIAVSRTQVRHRETAPYRRHRHLGSSGITKSHTKSH